MVTKFQLFARKQEELDLSQNIESDGKGEEEPEEKWVKHPQQQPYFMLQKNLHSHTSPFHQSTKTLVQLNFWLTSLCSFKSSLSRFLELLQIIQHLVSDASLKDAVIATKYQLGVISLQGIKKAVPAKFSTVLVHVGIEEGVLDGPLK
ncbi:hypothetical protein H0H87_011940, partial [Tephrocybe sp. NHM501043]